MFDVWSTRRYLVIQRIYEPAIKFGFDRIFYDTFDRKLSENKSRIKQKNQTNQTKFYWNLLVLNDKNE